MNECRLNKNDASIVIQVSMFLFFFDMHILACRERSVRVCKSWNPVYPWFNAVVKTNLLVLLKWTKLLDPSNFYLVWCLFISMARWCWSRAANNGWSTDNVRPDRGLDRSNSGLAGHFDRSFLDRNTLFSTHLSLNALYTLLIIRGAILNF